MKRESVDISKSRYVVSKDKKGSGLWYVHLEGHSNSPVIGSFTPWRREALRNARERNKLL